MNVCDWIVVMSSGQKLAEGTPDQVRQNPAVLEAYLGGQNR
jgi:ABC-type branched-subunit amino acid transport system ATPase component